MVKIILIGLWVVIVALGTSYAAINMRVNQKPEQNDHDKAFAHLETVKLKLISVPLVVNAKIEGYVMADLAFTIDAATLKKMTVKPDAFVRDEAFRALYSTEIFDFRQMKKGDLPTIAKMILENVNHRLGGHIVHDIFVQDLTFLARDQVRGGPKH